MHVAGRMGARVLSVAISEASKCGCCQSCRSGILNVYLLGLTVAVCVLCRSKGWGLTAFMGCGDTTRGEAWTFKCPPGHRIVGYAGIVSSGICFLTADFQDLDTPSQGEARTHSMVHTYMQSHKTPSCTLALHHLTRTPLASLDIPVHRPCTPRCTPT
jgi:hypothetical protein